MEQKLRKPSWRGEASIKQRFQVAPDVTPLFLKNGTEAIQLNLPFIEQLYKFCALFFVFRNF